MSKNAVNIHELIEQTAKTTIEEFYKEQKKEARDRIFHNTKLLMENYMSLKDHITKAVSNLSDAKAIKAGDIDLDSIVSEDREDRKEMEELIDTDELYIRSIEKSKFRTLTMVAHIDVSLQLLRKKTYTEEKSDEYQAFIDHYVYGKTYEELQNKFHVSEATPSRWINRMCRELGIFLFGVDGLKLR